MSDFLKQRERERKLEQIRGKAKGNGGGSSSPRPAQRNVSLHLAAKADESLRKAYLDLHTMKHELDQMEEIPAYLRGLYQEIMQALGALQTAQHATGQAREGAKRVARDMQR